MKTHRQLNREQREACTLLAEFIELTRPTLDDMGPTGGGLIRLHAAVNQATACIRKKS